MAEKQFHNQTAALSRYWSTALTLLLCVLNGCVLLLALATLMPAAHYFVDQAANLAAALLLPSFVLVLLTLITRRWLVALIGVIGCGVIIAVFVNGARLGPLAGVHAADGAERVVRLLIFNATTTNTKTEAVLDEIQRANADLVVLIETPPDVNRRLRQGTDGLDALPHRSIPDRPRVSATVLLSRWPMETLPLLVTDDREHHRRLRVVKVNREDGPFVVLATHPISPRHSHRWHAGNVTVQRLIDQFTDLRDQHEYPLLAAGDFNSTPTGYRSRLISRETGLRRARPLLTLEGTWPTRLPRWMGLPIDDAFVPEEVKVLQWRTGEAAGSSHRSVMIELEM